MGARMHDMAARVEDTKPISRRVLCAITAPLLLLAACGGLGVEQYRETVPRGTLALRRVAGPDREGVAEVVHLPRLVGEGTVALEPGAILRATHIAHVQLVDTGEGERLIVLQLHEEGRQRLLEATRDADGTTLALVADDVVIATPTLRGALDQTEIAVRIERPYVRRAFRALTP